MFAPDPAANERRYDCVHEAELVEFYRIMEIASYNKGCICLCMTNYKNIPEPSDCAAYRDSVTCVGLNALGYHATSLNFSHSENVNPGIHCFANLNNVARLKSNMEAAWKKYESICPINTDIVLDNTRMPVRIYILTIITTTYSLYYNSIARLCWINSSGKFF